MREGHHLLAEAPTGSGKSLAYLAPAIASGMRVIVATSTIALQSQLIDKDLPTLQQFSPLPFTYGLLKGRANYLCRGQAAYRGRAGRAVRTTGRCELREASRDLAGLRAASSTGDRATLPRRDTAGVVGGGELHEHRVPRRHGVRGRRRRASRSTRRRPHARCGSSSSTMRSIARTSRPVTPCCPTTTCWCSTKRTRSPTTRRTPSRPTSTPKGWRVSAACSRTPASTRAPSSGSPAPRSALGTLIDERDGGIDVASDTTPRRHADRGRREPRDRASARRPRPWRSRQARRSPRAQPAHRAAPVGRARRRRCGLGRDGRAIGAPAARRPDRGRSGDRPHAARSRDRSSRCRQRSADRRRSTSSRARSASNPTNRRAHGRTKPARTAIAIAAPEPGEDTSRGPRRRRSTGGSRDCSTSRATCPHHPARHGRRAPVTACARSSMRPVGARSCCAPRTRTSSGSRRCSASGTSHTVLTQGDSDTGRLMRSFVDDETSVLVGTRSFWAGIDAPGVSCVLVVIDKLPFPAPDEPLHAARRSRAEQVGLNPFADRRHPGRRARARAGRRPSPAPPQRSRRGRGARPAPRHTRLPPGAARRAPALQAQHHARRGLRLPCRVPCATRRRAGTALTARSGSP